MDEIRIPGVSAQADAPILLALSPIRFQTELEALAATGKVRILTIDQAAQGRLVRLFYDGCKFDLEQFCKPDEGSRLAQRQRDFRAFLRDFLPTLFDEMGIRGVLTATYYYLQDLDLAMVGEEVGYPWIVLHRENLAPTLRQASVMSRFAGSLLVSHNEHTRKMLVDFGFVHPERAQALGCPRMDRYLRVLAEGQPQKKTRKKVALFSFVHGVGMKSILGGSFSENRDFGFVRLFEDVHGEFARLAKARPDVDFVVKLKWPGRGPWEDEVLKAFCDAGVRPEEVPNLVVTGDGDAQALILESDVIVGFWSTALLEAAIANKPVIVPKFHEAALEYYEQFLVFKDQLDELFLVGRSPDEYRQLILDAIDNPPEIDDATMKHRWAAFEHYVSNAVPDSADRYTDAIRGVLSALPTSQLSA